MLLDAILTLKVRQWGEVGQVAQTEVLEERRGCHEQVLLVERDQLALQQGAYGAVTPTQL